MNKYFVFSFLIVAVFVIAGCTNSSNKIGTIDTDCTNLCGQAKEICAEFMSVDECKNQCTNWDEAAKDKIKNASNCSELLLKSDGEGLKMVPEINDPNLPSAKNDCEAACNKYVTTCLTLVPNASETIFNDGYNSCLGECVKWDAKKVDCMIAANNCPSMTDVCGL
jgi:outer membrane murein-binding lipoprotein Lpp